MKVTTQQFREEARKALGDEILQRALAKAKPGFINKRKKAVDALPEFDALRADARAITEHALAHLDYYLERFEANVVANGGVVVVVRVRGCGRGGGWWWWLVVVVVVA